MGRHGFTGRHGETRPDEKISSERKDWIGPVTTSVNRMEKKRAKAKRRARDKQLIRASVD